MIEPLNVYTAIRMSETDRKLLDAIARLDGDASISAIVRSLLRQEARRRGVILDANQPTQQKAATSELQLETA
jgi:hypothetical protein